ncbi:KRAB [Mytilus coruscus]|uniref:KRAB n=1 Tax=Mytilus coruscus TaxID=42192 RepID=A0A6J8AQV5_MYTCO|nr:KRAB [Mytilus coruscus]
MDDKVECNRNDIQRNENLPDVQRKSILEIAGQQIIGDESGLSVEDTSSTDNNRQSSQREPLNVGKSVLELTTIFQIIENMCLKLTDYGEEFVMIMANPYKQTSNYIGSEEGRQFMNQNTSVMQEFVKHCYNAACSLSVPAAKSGQEINPNKADEHCSSEVSENSANKRTAIEFSDNNSETNGFESDVTENYDVEKIVQNAVQVVDKNLDELKSIEEEITKTNTTPQNIKEYPHPKKRLTKMKAQEDDETDDSKTSKAILKMKNSKSPLVNKKMSKSKYISKSQKQDKKNGKNKNNKFECKTCFLMFDSSSLLKQHLVKHKADTSTNIICSCCKKTFKTKFKLRKHMKSKHMKYHTIQFTKKMYKCEKCGKLFHRQDTFKSHVKFHEAPKHQCQICDKTFYLKTNLSKHKKTHKKRLECRSCLAVFTDRENYELHNCQLDEPENFTRTYNSWVTEDGKHVCGICQKVFTKRRGLLTHQTKEDKRRRRDGRYVDIAIKPGYDVNLMMPQRNESLTMENVMPSSNLNQSTDISQLYPVQFTESSTYTDEACSDTSSVINKGPQQASHADSPIRVIDDSRHQFLMHQLTPVTSLIMESADGQQIQLPNEMYVMQVGLPDDSHVTNSNLINPTQAYSPNNDVLQANQTHSMHSYNKFF